MTVAHHPDDATLMSYAAGSLPEALAVVTAAHLAQCSHCRRKLSVMERIGGALLAGLDVASVGRTPMPKPSGETTRHAAEPLSRLPAKTGELPMPLADLVGPDLSVLHWKRLLPGVWRHEIALSGGKPGYLMLLRADPGRAIPQHGHGGSELTLVLRGAYADETGRYECGDCADLDEDIEHRPVADAKVGCVCVVASETRPRLAGFLGRLMQPFIGR
jgi:putative transcriptional regulator